MEAMSEEAWSNETVGAVISTVGKAETLWAGTDEATSIAWSWCTSDTAVTETVSLWASDIMTVATIAGEAGSVMVTVNTMSVVTWSMQYTMTMSANEVAMTTVAVMVTVTMAPG